MVVVGDNGFLSIPMILDCSNIMEFWAFSFASKFKPFCKGLGYCYSSSALHIGCFGCRLGFHRYRYEYDFVDSILSMELILWVHLVIYSDFVVGMNDLLFC